MFRMLLRSVLLGCMPESSFRVGHVGRKPLLQHITAHVVCLAKVRGRCPLNPPLAADKVRDVDVSSLDWNSSGCSVRANRSINDSSDVFQNGTFKRTSVERLSLMSWLAEAIPTQRRSNNPSVRSTTKAGAVGHPSPRTEVKQWRRKHTAGCTCKPSNRNGKS
jgi:hypothetical protein